MNLPDELKQEASQKLGKAWNRALLFLVFFVTSFIGVLALSEASGKGIDAINQTIVGDLITVTAIVVVASAVVPAMLFFGNLAKGYKEHGKAVFTDEYWSDSA